MLLGPGQTTPAPWVNVIANPQFGTVVSESGCAYTWAENSHEFRLTPWYNDPVTDASGEALYLRDEETGHFWSPSPLPARGQNPYVARHGFGYSMFEYAEDGIVTELSIYVAMDAPVKFARLKITNRSGRPRELSVTGYWEFVLGELRDKSLMHVATELDPASGALFARNAYSAEFADRVVFVDCSEANRTVTGDRTEFLGRNGTLANPAAMRRVRLSGRVGAGLDPCAAMQVPCRSRTDRRRKSSSSSARPAAKTRRGNLFSVSAARPTPTQPWKACGITGAGRWARSTSKRLTRPSTSWSTAGWFTSRSLAGCGHARVSISPAARSASAINCRTRWPWCMPSPVCCANIFSAPPAASSAKGTCSTGGIRPRDEAYARTSPMTTSGSPMRRAAMSPRPATPACSTSGAVSAGATVASGEEANYDLPHVSDDVGTLYEHCLRAIDNGLRFGAHGLPLMGCGDWNDGMNLVGQHGKGESVWLAFFLYDVLMQFAELARQRGDVDTADKYTLEAGRLRGNIEEHGWDGEWYRRAYFDDGTPLGSAVNSECQIDSISQSWSVLSGAGTNERMTQAMENLDRRLVRRDARLIQLLDPPFDKSDLNPGYIKGYVPGVRENGGQYTHGAIWTVMAFAAMGDAKRAWELFALINPVTHADTPEASALYRVEPYVVAADVYAVPPHTGRGGWTWYTGSAGWMYRLITESLLGLRLDSGQASLRTVPPRGLGLS